jgi:hypothetical protein
MRAVYFQSFRACVDRTDGHRLLTATRLVALASYDGLGNHRQEDRPGSPHQAPRPAVGGPLGGHGFWSEIVSVTEQTNY